MFIIYDTKVDVDGFVQFADTEKGYPKDGVIVPGGIPCKPGEGRTLRATEPIKHPKEDLWAVSINRIEDLKPAGKTPINKLDAEWFPPFK